MEIRIPPMPINESSKIFNYVLLDNPLIFHTKTFSQTNYLNKKKYGFKPNYKYPKQMMRSYKSTVLKFLQVFDPIKTKSDADKELHVHDYCVKNFSYDYSFGEYAHNILGPVVHKTAVCEGIAKFAKLALDYLGVKSLVAIGRGDNPANGTTEGHAWNIVKLEDKTYHLDVTFDLCMSDNTIRYDYFNLCDEDIKRDHVITGDVPKCMVSGSDYYTLNSQVLRSSNALKRYIGDNLRQGSKTIVFKADNVYGIDDIENKVLQIAAKQYAKINNKSAEAESRYNPRQMVLEINFK